MSDLRNNHPQIRVNCIKPHTELMRALLRNHYLEMSRRSWPGLAKARAAVFNGCSSDLQDVLALRFDFVCSGLGIGSSGFRV